MRRQEVQIPIRPSERAISPNRTGLERPWEAGSRLMLTLLAILSLLLMFASRAALAEPSDLAMHEPLSALPAALAPAPDEEASLFGSSSFPEATPELTAPPVAETPSATRQPISVPVRELGALLAVRATSAAYLAAKTDAKIAAAVAEGSRPDLEPKKSFRKKNFDLFRTEHEVQILRNDMLLRLRLRAKSRETMSVELRF